MKTNLLKNPLGKKLSPQAAQQLMALAALLILYVYFAIFGTRFLSPGTFVSILDSSYYIGFLAIGMTFVIITAGIDLSSGTVMVGSALVGGVAYNVWGAGGPGGPGGPGQGQGQPPVPGQNGDGGPGGGQSGQEGTQTR